MERGKRKMKKKKNTSQRKFYGHNVTHSEQFNVQTEMNENK